MTKYSWDIKELLRKRDFIGYQLKVYEELFDLYDGLVKSYNKKYTERPNIICNPIGYFLYLKEQFSQIPSERLELLKDSIDVIAPFDSKLEEPKFSSLSLSDKELVEFARTLFEKIPNKYFLTKFDEFTDPKKKLLHIRNHQTLPTDSFGLTYTDPIEHVSYGLVARYKSVQDVITLGHEVIHMIIREFEDPLFAETNKPTYVETEGFFANLLFSNMLRELGCDEEELSLFEKRDLNTNIDTIKTCFVINEGFNKMDNDGNINFDSLANLLKSKNIYTPVNKDNFGGFVTDELGTDVNYAVSYLTALDLYEQYQSDPEKTLYLLQHIPLLSGDEPKKDLENIGVYFFEDGYQNLEKNCKRLLKVKTTSKKK